MKFCEICLRRKLVKSQLLRAWDLVTTMFNIVRLIMEFTFTTAGVVAAEGTLTRVSADMFSKITCRGKDRKN
jgi:hypothetical protein